MRKPSTTFKWVDNSGKLTEAPSLETRPLFLQPASFDRGPEDMRVVYGTDFYKLYGSNISYKKHGQPAIQAANIIDNGGEILVKRIVADDATLANLIVLARVSQDRTFKVDPVSGKQVYIDSETGQETFNSKNLQGIANERAMVNTASIKYEVANVTDAKTLAEVEAQAKTLLSERDATTVQGAGDPVDWIRYEGVLVNGSEGPIKEEKPTIGEDGQPTGSTTYVYYDEGTIIQDSAMNVFKVITDNKLQLLGSALSEYVYPIIVVTDNGRGESSKRFNISYSSTISKGVGFAVYDLTYLGTVGFDRENVRFSCDHEVIYNDKSMSLSMSGKDLVQLKAAMLEEESELFLNKVSEFSGIELDELRTIDVFFGHNNKGYKISNITVDPEGYQIDSDYGMMLQGGSNGSFGNAPFGTKDYSDKLIEFFTGEFDDAIYDPDRYKIEACVDANYPVEVKTAIARLATAREDFMYYRDYGTGRDVYEAVIQGKIEVSTIRNKFIADYFTTYDVVDKFTKKQIPVTIGFSIARLLVKHLNNRRNTPFAGLLYDITIPEAIEGTVNFIPKVTPYVDQEQLLTDQHINYASYLNNVLVIQTQLTSQDEETQCSHINNINTVQGTIRDIRTLCPRIRGSFIGDTDSMEKYASKINDVINRHKDEYSSIELTWTADDILVNNKIFNAALNVSFKNFVIAEIFTIYTKDAIADSV